MNQLQLCAKLYAIAGIDQVPENIECAAKLNFDNGRAQVASQVPVVNMLASIPFLLCFFPGHAIAASGTITDSFPFQDGLAHDSRGMTLKVPLDRLLFNNSVTRIHYSDFRSIPLIIGSRNREES
jgi:hypothetical protein